MSCSPCNNGMTDGTCPSLSTLGEARDYVKRRLGHPVLCVEIADEQIDIAICDAIQTFIRYNYGEGSFEDYIAFTVSAGTSAYDLSATDIEDVTDFRLSSPNNGINTLFSDTHQILYNDWVVQGNYPGGPGGGSGSGYGQGMILANYDISLMYLEEVRRKFAPYYRADYLQGNQVLRISPTPKENGIGLLVVYRRQKAEFLFNHILVKNLSVALAKKQWSLHLKKTLITLPGGGTLNASEIYSDGLAEEEKWLEAIIQESEPPMFFIS